MTDLHIIESSHMMRLRDVEERLYNYTLRDNNSLIALASYSFERENESHVCTNDRREFERSNVRIISDNTHENFAQHAHAVKRDQTRTFARCEIDSNVITFTIVANFTINDARKHVKIMREAQYDESYSASAENDAQIALDCARQSIDVMNMIEDSKKLRAKIAACMTLFMTHKDSENEELKAKAWACFNAAKRYKIALAEMLENLNCSDLFE